MNHISDSCPSNINLSGKWLKDFIDKGGFEVSKHSPSLFHILSMIYSFTHIPFSIPTHSFFSYSRMAFFLTPPLPFPHNFVISFLSLTFLKSFQRCAYNAGVAVVSPNTQVIINTTQPDARPTGAVRTQFIKNIYHVEIDLLHLTALWYIPKHLHRRSFIAASSISYTVHSIEYSTYNSTTSYTHS